MLIDFWFRSGSSANFEIAVSGRITSLDTPLDKNTVLCCTKDHTLEIVDLRKRTVLKSFQYVVLISRRGLRK